MHARRSRSPVHGVCALALIAAGCAGSGAGGGAGEAAAQGDPADASSVWERARRRGVDFRAFGNEPGWHLEIRDGEGLRFVHAYGQQWLQVPATALERDPPEGTRAGRTRYRAVLEGGDLVLEIAEAPCTDSMSGERFAYRVTVERGERTWRGCGRSLR